MRSESSHDIRKFSSFWFAILCSSVLVLDSIIIRIYASIPREPSMLVTLVLFEGIYAFLLLSSYIFLRALQRGSSMSDVKIYGLSRVPFPIMVCIQLILCALVGTISISLAFFGAYDMVIISLITYFSLLPAMGFLGFLSYHLLRSFKIVRNYSVLMYACAFALLIANLGISTAYLSIQISQYVSYLGSSIEIKSIRTYIFFDPSPSVDMARLGVIYEYAAVPIFLLIWIPTALQLRTYFVTMGNAKFWTLILIPLLYYFFPLITDEIGVFESLRLEYGSEFNLIYTIIFGPYKQVGGLLFGLIFWITSLRVNRKALQRTLQLAGTGFILLFGATVLHGTSYIAAPPFGFITLTFTPLAAFLVMFGLYASAILLSRDARLRREIRNLVTSDSSLVQSIASAQEEQQKKRLVELNEKIQRFARETGTDAPLDELDLRDYLDQVLWELKRDKK